MMKKESQWNKNFRAFDVFCSAVQVYNVLLAKV